LIRVDGVIDRQFQFPEKSVQGDPDIVGVVIPVADEGKNARMIVIGWDATALFP
jgi:hypothetical protein